MSLSWENVCFTRWVRARILAGLALAWATCSVTTAQTAPHLEFEVASVKLSPATKSFTTLDRGGPESSNPGSWSCEYYSLRNLLSKAFALDDSQITGPPWMANQRFHINAKLAPTTTREQFREMLRNLLIDRFSLGAHRESRVVARYELGVVKSDRNLLGKSVERLPGTERAGAPRRPALDSDGFPRLGPPSSEPEILTIQGRTRLFFPKTSMKDLAEELATKLGRPVADVTGLFGEYDIGLYWSDDDSGQSLKEALRDQLGLRLSEKKGPVDFVVVDRIEKLPTGN